MPTRTSCAAAGLAALLMLAVAGSAVAEAAVRKDRATRILEQRAWQRQQTRRQNMVAPPSAEQQRSRPVPPTSPNSAVVPNR